MTNEDLSSAITASLNVPLKEDRIPSLTIKRQLRGERYPFPELYTKMSQAKDNAKVWVMHFMLPQELPKASKEKLELSFSGNGVVLLDYVFEGTLERIWRWRDAAGYSRGYSKWARADIIIHKPEPVGDFYTYGYKFRDFDDYGILVSNQTYIQHTEEFDVRLIDVYLCFASPILMWHWVDDFICEWRPYMSVKTFTRMTVVVNRLKEEGEALYEDYKRKYERIGWREGIEWGLLNEESQQSQLP